MMLFKVLRAIVGAVLLWTIKRSDAEVVDCSWFGSGQPVTKENLSRGREESERSVRPVSLSCSEGKVKWTHPSGALLVHHRIPVLDPSLHEYTFCIRTMRAHKGVSIHRKVNNILIPLITGWNSGNNEMCFCAGPSVTLFLQASGLSPLREYSWWKDSVSGYFFSAKPLKRSRPRRFLRPNPLIEDGDGSECRPCERAELVEAFCSDSFIFKGRFHSGTTKKENGEEYELGFLIDALIRKPLDFKEVLGRIRFAKKTKMLGTVTFPSTCSLDLHGLSPKDSFLIIGKMDLGRAKLHCGVPWGDWETFRLSKDTGAPCELR